MSRTPIFFSVGVRPALYFTFLYWKNNTVIQMAEYWYQPLDFCWCWRGLKHSSILTTGSRALFCIFWNFVLPNVIWSGYSVPTEHMPPVSILSIRSLSAMCSYGRGLTNGCDSTRFSVRTHAHLFIFDRQSPMAISISDLGCVLCCTHVLNAWLI